MSECVVYYESVALCIGFLPYLWQNLGECISRSLARNACMLCYAVYCRLFLSVHVLLPTLSTNLNFLVLRHIPCPGKAAAGWPKRLGRNSRVDSVPHRRCPCYPDCPDVATSGVGTGRSQASGHEEGPRPSWDNRLPRTPGWPNTGPGKRQYSGTWRAVHAAAWSKMLKTRGLRTFQQIQHWLKAAHPTLNYKKSH